jgi:uncharacterized membrane protein
MDVTRIILRLIHIFSGIFWVGGTWMMTTYISGSAKALGDDATKFMQHFTLRSGFQRGMSIAAPLAVLSGAWLYYLIFGDAIVINTGAGLALTVGGAAGLIAFYFGAFVIGRGTNQMRDIADAIGKKGGPPSAGQLKEMNALQEKISGAGATVAILMVIAVAGMTLSEYFAI